MHRLLDGRAFPLLFLIVYLAVDWVTFIHDPPALNVTPWNPPAGLYVALLLLGARGAPLLTFAALMLGDILVRGLPAPLLLVTASNLLIVLGYTAGAWLLRHMVKLQPGIESLYDLVWLVVAVPLGAVPVALGFALPYVLGGILGWHELVAVTAQYWLGDVIGILGVTPLLLVHLHRETWNAPAPRRVEALLQSVAVGAALLTVFNPLVPDPSKLFYVLFLPVIWTAMRRGLPGATMAILATQLGVVVGLQAFSSHWDDLAYYQTLMVALAATGLLIGAVVSERWRLEHSLRERQSELARVSRLSLLGEMASSLAHELNQPLFTTVGYTKAGRQLLLRGAEPAAVVDLMDRAVAEAERAADVLRSIRGFLRQGGRPVPVSLPGIIDETLALARPEAQRKGITITVAVPDDVPRLLADKVQIDQVLLNLVRNSVDALSGQADRNKHIRISAIIRDGMAEVSVADTGPGVPQDKIGPLFDLFFTTKPSGMGLGLPICRSIIEAHGGRLWLADNGPDGSRFSFTLPAAAT